ncbi:hypothetical protein [Streptomyces sennicomposti]|uniref:hypothetical protein n=1 Tax=Streptomyces sennicomposti TaxID=2873384 RepID=UPI001CA70A59|nr:hypothetical protein [Streptomyces sennicomposti]MBY8870163.1 hypothetical protein [Streptomyces sennicomposti]
MNTGNLMILATLSPIIVPLWIVASGLFCIRVGHKAESVRLGWFFFLILGLLPIGGLFAAIGKIMLAGVATGIGGIIVIMIILDWYGDRSSP